jgi:hypothetical protein
MIQVKDGHFRFERPTPSRVGFFLWLEAIQPSLGTRITLQVLDTFSIKEPSHKGGRPASNVILQEKISIGAI